LRKHSLFAAFVAASFATLFAFEPVATSASPEGGAANASNAGDAGSHEGGATVLRVLSKPPTQGLSDFKIDKTPPDPDPPIKERKQWIFDLRWDKGDVFFLGAHALDLGEPRVTPRMMGRFALELFQGPMLIERVRFDFPMLGAGEPRNAGYMAPPSLEKKLVTRIGVMFPATARGTRLELYDRATGLRYRLPWPPQENSGADEDAGPNDKGTDAAAD
jgi:hypothetical protein